jgi:N-acetylglucosamine-6-phosphate deacetylase
VTLLTGARVVTPAGVLDDGWVEVMGGRIAGVGTGGTTAPEEGQLTDLRGGWLVPGFVDLHMHGGGGHDAARSAADLRAAVAFHRRHGTTRTLVSLMAAPVDVLCEQLAWLVEAAAADQRIAGAHLEGPFLSAARCGAQNHAHLLPPDPLVLAKLLDAGQHSVRTITVAPELPGALQLIADITEAGVVAAVGHTDATYEQAAAGFAAGARVATHLFNAMGAISQRAPGPGVAALDSAAVLEVINDGVHVHDALTALVARCAPDRLALITDAMSATGLGDGEYPLGDRPVLVRNGQARLAGSSRLAGSTLTMDRAFARLVADLHLPIELAVAASSTTPARLLGLGGRCGAVAAGLDADLVHLSDDLRVQRVMIDGRWLP